MKTEATYPVKGMHCASCASIIEKTLMRVDGVVSAGVNYGTEKLAVVFDADKTDPQKLSDAIGALGYTLVMPASQKSTPAADPKTEKLAELAALKRKTVTIMPLVVISAFIMVWDVLDQARIVVSPAPLKEFLNHLMPLMATYALFVTGTPYLQGLWRFLRRGVANMDTLIGLGTSAAFLYSFTVSAFEKELLPYLHVEHTYYDTTIIVIGFITLGKFLEARAKLRTGDAIEKLLGLQAKTARVIRADKEIEIPVDDVVVGDIIIVKPGGRIPVDGVVVSGESYVDEAMVTGEPVPVAKQARDKIVGGTLNTTGSFTFRATRIGAETLLASIIRMVETAQGSKAPIQALADRISAVFVPIVLVIAFIALIAWIIFAPASMGFAAALSYGLSAFVGVLVIACPCALGLATPTAIIVGVGKGAQHGILVKDAAVLEKLVRVDTVIVDKTGTLTKGRPELAGFEIYGHESEKDILAILAALESRSEHPLAQAILNRAEALGVSVKAAEKFEIIKGKGVRGVVEAQDYYAGNPRLMEDLGLAPDAASIAAETAKGKTPVFLSSKNKILALIWIADAVKPETAKAIADLQMLGLDVAMLTGDNPQTARYVADLVGIKTVVAGVLPQDKLDYIKKLRKSGHHVAMAGDGINDAPALAEADVGIAMGTGADVAIDTAGITLLHGDIVKLVKSFHLARLTMNGIKQNLFWAFIFNLVGIPLAAGVFYPFFGWTLSPVFAGVAMAFSSVTVVSNSLRLKWKEI